MGPLAERIALVSGASRGVGRGIAHELGLSGATVYVTGRSRRGRSSTDGLPGTIDETAGLVTESGGRGIAIECDHTCDNAVERLASKIRVEQGRLDLLVNNVWGGYERYDVKVWQLPLWKQPVWRWDKMFETGVRAHYTTSRSLCPLLLKSAAPLIVNVSAGDEGKFLGDVQYDVSKNATDRLGFALARKLMRFGITVVTIHPGFTRTERVVRHASQEQLDQTHSPRFVGRAVVALAMDPDVPNRSGGVFKAGQLGLDYEFTDYDGSQPEPFVIPDGYGQ